MPRKKKRETITLSRVIRLLSGEELCPLGVGERIEILSNLLLIATLCLDEEEQARLLTSDSAEKVLASAGLSRCRYGTSVLQVSYRLDPDLAISIGDVDKHVAEHLKMAAATSEQVSESVRINDIRVCDV